MDTIPSGSDTYEMQTINANETRDAKKYIYIVVTPKNTEIPATFTTSVEWYYGKPGTVSYVIQGQSTPVTINIVKGQIVPTPNLSISDGYVPKYYSDADYTEEIDITTFAT